MLATLTLAQLYGHLLLQVTDASTVVLTVKECPMIKLDDKHYKLVDKVGVAACSAASQQPALPVVEFIIGVLTCCLS